MRAIRVRISIDAKATDVFRVLTDFDSYEKWNPWLSGVKGQAKEGERVMVRPNLVSLLGFKLCYRLTKIQAPDFLRWDEEAWFDKIFSTTREYHVYTRASGGSIYSVELHFSGPIAAAVEVFYSRAVKKGLNEEALALKKYCERGIVH